MECARAGVTTGEWAWALREVFGEFRAPTGVSSAPVAVAAEAGTPLALVREKVARTAADLGVGKAAPAGRQARPRRALATAPSRSPYGPGTPASRWSTRASG